MTFHVKAPNTRSSSSAIEWTAIRATCMEVSEDGTLLLFDQTTADGKVLVAAFPPGLWNRVTREGAA